MQLSSIDVFMHCTHSFLKVNLKYQAKLLQEKREQNEQKQKCINIESMFHSRFCRKERRLLSLDVFCCLLGKRFA